jgi:OOP family OmpA-OmpF porin
MLAAVLSWDAAPVPAQAPVSDAAGCRESAVVSRHPGCSIVACVTQQPGAFEVVIDKHGEIKTLQGTGERLTFICPVQTSHLQLLRGAEAALTKAGYTIVFSGPHEQHEQPAVTAQKGAQWIMLQTAQRKELPMYEQTAVLVQETAPLSSSAQAMADALAASGRLDFYGVTFAAGQAVMMGASEAVLGDVLAVLSAHPDWRLRIEGHTDNVGDRAANLKLSTARAAAVAAWLTGKGVAAGRLAIAGLGDTQPIADNATDDGRARNRRIVLIQQSRQFCSLFAFHLLIV